MLALALSHSASFAQQNHEPASQFRRPIAMLALPDRLLVANQRSGSISSIDPVGGSVIGEVAVGEQLSDLIALPDGKSVLALDEAKGEAIQLSIDGDSPTISQHVAVGTSPATACLWPDQKTCSIALLWAHRLAIVDLSDAAHPQLHVSRTIDLPFAPRLQWISPDHKTLLVADSFGGTLALFDLPAGTLRGYRWIDANNIRGIAASADGRDVHISHLMLASDLPTERDRVFWGQLLGNTLRTVNAEHLLYPAERESLSVPYAIEHWKTFPLGVTNNGAGDPGQIIAPPDGSLLVALSGVDQVGIRPHPDERLLCINVGRRPTALAMDAARHQAYVANTLGDSISVIDLPTFSVTRTISLGPRPKPSAADRGESLFYDARLSLDGWYSCASCHTDGHTCGLLNDNYTDGSFSTPKRILSLRGTADTGPWAWNGSNATLEEQIKTSILSTMKGSADAASEQNISDLAAYLHTLKPAPSLDGARGTIDASAIAKGKQVFERLDCASCHRPPAYTSAKNFDVGLRDEMDLKKFNPPSLRGVSQLPAMFHDNRARDLREVFTRFRHPDGKVIPAEDVDALVAFLRSL
ncbi:MAG TPA: cytochrome c peroxidase [Humisphaera sp.]|nr:cytochrome c peroxidase [Humisphaera sp.]